jgi:zinc protease
LHSRISNIQSKQAGRQTVTSIRHRINTILISTVCTLAGPLSATAAPLDDFMSSVRKTTLDNGLTVLTREDGGSGVVAITSWVKAGYFHEPDEVAGMAHLFEHMFFKGSKNFPGAEQISDELSALGGQTNAGTIYDRTSYYFVLPAEAFERGLAIQADAIMHPLFDPEELAKESEVVIEESNRKKDRASAMAFENMLATSFTEHRIRRWRIGSDDVLRTIDRGNLMTFFDGLYRPENIVLSIAGDIDHDQALAAVRETFGKLPRGELKKQGGPAEPRQQDFRYGQDTADIQQGFSVFGWHTPGVANEDEVALDALAAILGDGRSSRLYREVVGPQGASEVSSYHGTFEDVGIFTLSGEYDPANRASVDQRIVGAVERMKAHGPTAVELAAAKNAALSGTVFGLEEVLGQSMTLAGQEALYGSYQALAERLAALDALTAADIQRVAEKYLTLEGMTLYHYLPNTSETIDAERAREEVERATAMTVEAPEEVPPPAEAQAIALAEAAGAVKTIELDGGMTLLVQERPGVPVVSTAIYFPGGRSKENSLNAGITRLTAEAMKRGTQNRSGEEINREIEFLGTQIDPVIEEDYFGLSLDILGSSYRSGLDLLADVVLNPTFEEEAVEKEKFLQLASIKRNIDSSFRRPFELALEALYGAHSYGLPEYGYAESLGGLNAAAVRDWYQKNVHSDGALVVVVGDIKAAEAKKLIEESFSELSTGRSDNALAAPQALAARRDLVEYRQRQQTAFVQAFDGVPANHEDWPAIRTIRYIASGFSGTFFKELRSERSLAYTVFATDVSNASGGAFIAYIAGDASKEEEARQAMLDEFHKLATSGFTQEDFDRARAYYAGSTRIGLQTNAAQAQDFAHNYFLKRPLETTTALIEKMNALTLDELRATADKYFSGAVYATGIVRGVE